MDKKWTPEREKALIRNKDGTFKRWKGGKKKSELKKKETTAHGIKTHIGKEFKRQNGRTAVIGSIVRTKKKDGSHHKGAYWYIMTKKGWRVCPSKERKPSKAYIAKILREAKNG